MDSSFAFLFVFTRHILRKMQPIISLILASFIQNFCYFLFIRFKQQYENMKLRIFYYFRKNLRHRSSTGYQKTLWMLNLNIKKLTTQLTAWKVSIFGVILVRMFPHLDWIRRDAEYLSVFSPKCGKIRTRITPNMDTFYSVTLSIKKYIKLSQSNQMSWTLNNIPLTI